MKSNYSTTKVENAKILSTIITIKIIRINTNQYNEFGKTSNITVYIKFIFIIKIKSATELQFESAIGIGERTNTRRGNEPSQRTHYQYRFGKRKNLN